jgi:hypothetical protein
MRITLHLFLAGLLALSPVPSLADQQNIVFGNDTYATGQVTSISGTVPGDVFGAGNTVLLSAAVGSDAHLAGFDVQANSDVAGNLYAAGFSVSVAGGVKGDANVIGNTVTIHSVQPIGGNLRAAAATFTLDSPANGSVLVTAETATLNAPVQGDFSFYGRNLVFGPNAVVNGQVLVHAPTQVAVPATVAPAERVVFTQLTSPEYPTQVGQTAEVVAKAFWASLWAATLWWVLLLIVGAAFIALNGRLVGSLERLSAVRPMRRLGLGILAFASVVGLVPFVALTLVGLLLVPFVLIFVVVACSLAYVAGVYLIGRAIGARFRPLDTVAWKVGILAISLVIAGLLTMIPFLGWLITLAITAYGFGVVTALIMTRWSADDRTLLAAPPSNGAAMAANNSPA